MRWLRDGLRHLELTVTPALRTTMRGRTPVWRALKTVRRRLGERALARGRPDGGAAVGRPYLFGVNLAGYLTSEKGIGQAARADLRALESVGIPYVANDVGDPGSRGIRLRTVAASRTNPYRVNLIRVNARDLWRVADAFGVEYFRSRYNVAAWTWELPELPDDWRRSFEFFDEIWVPSRFVRDAVAQAAPIPVVTIPHAIEGDSPDVAALDRAELALSRDAFVFLFVFDFASQAGRKNPLGLIEAYARAFGGRADIVLVLKTVHADDFHADARALREASAGRRVTMVDGVWEPARVRRLLAMCDCYVSLHRSEGFGLTLAEAMGLGKPVVATAYGGNVDYMTPENSFLVPYRLVTIERDHGPYRKGGSWAEPDLDHAAALMRHVYLNRAAAAAAGARARQEIRDVLHPRAVGRLMAQRLLAAGAPPTPAVASARPDRG